MIQKLKYLIWHCTATPEDRFVTPEDIIRWHTAKPPIGRGWSKVGYSKLVLLDGTVHSFVDENDDDFVDPWELTYGVAGLNSISRHYCYVGGLDKRTFKPKDTRTNLQLISMKKLTENFIKKYSHLNIKIRGHNDFSSKSCPCFNVKLWISKDPDLSKLINNS